MFIIIQQPIYINNLDHSLFYRVTRPDCVLKQIFSLEDEHNSARNMQRDVISVLKKELVHQVGKKDYYQKVLFQFLRYFSVLDIFFSFWNFFSFWDIFQFWYIFRFLRYFSVFEIFFSFWDIFHFWDIFQFLRYFSILRYFSVFEIFNRHVLRPTIQFSP